MNLYLIEYYTNDSMINFAWIKADSRFAAWNRLCDKRPDARDRISIEEHDKIINLACFDPGVVHNLT